MVSSNVCYFILWIIRLKSLKELFCWLRSDWELGREWRCLETRAKDPWDTIRVVHTSIVTKLPTWAIFFIPVCLYLYICIIYLLYFFCIPLSLFLGIPLFPDLYLYVASIYTIMYFLRLWKSGRAEADFVGGISIYNLLFQQMKFREGKGWFCRRNTNL